MTLVPTKYIILFPLIVICILGVLAVSGCQKQEMAATSSGGAFSPAARTENQEITAFVGSSAKGAMDPAGQLFFQKTGIKVYFNYGGSGSLLSQMELSRTGDLFIPASPDYIAKATADKVIYPDTETKIYYLIPAMLVQKGNPQNIKSLADLARPGLKISLADPKIVPAGLYAYEVLDYNKFLTGVGKNVVVYRDSYEKIVSDVILKAVDAAIGWDTIGLQQPDNLDLVYLQPNQIPRLSYMSGVISTYAQNRTNAQSFLNFLVSPDGRAIFEQNGYYTTLDEVKKFAPTAQIGGEYKLPANYTPLVK